MNLFMKNVNVKKHNTNSWIFLLLIAISTLFMSSGYATINSIKGEISGTLLAQAQEGVFITNMVYSSDVNAVPENFKIKSLYQTLLESKIQLGYDSNSSITYSITVHNSSTIDYYFKETTYDQGQDYYDNSDIIFSLENIECGDKVLKGEDITFNITFKYKENLSTVTNTILNSFIKFVFVPAEDVNKVILAYNGENTTYLLPKDSQEGTFTNVIVDSGVVVRCNNGAIPTFSNNNVGFTNVTEETFCQVFNTLKEAVESSDATTNNYLMIANENPTQGMSMDSEKTANIDINGKTINYIAGTDSAYITNYGQLKISDKIGTGLLKVDYRCIDNNGKLIIDSGNYQREESSSTAGGIVGSKGGTVTLSNSNFTVDQVFAVFVQGDTEQTMHIQNCTITSKTRDAVANLNPKAVISIANSNIISESSNAIYSNSSGSTYICNSTVSAGISDFSYSSTGKLYYASNVTFKSGNNTPTVNDSSYAVKNYTTTTSVDWYLVRDTEGTLLKYSDGTTMKIGDKIRIVSRIEGNYNFLCDVNDGSFESGSNIQLFHNNNSNAQEFLLLASTEGNYFNIAPYAATSLYLNISGATGDNGANIALANGSDAVNERFCLVKSDEEGYYYFRSSYGTNLDVNGAIAADGQNVQSWEANGTNAQRWKLEKDNFAYLEEFNTWNNYTLHEAQNVSCSNGIITLKSNNTIDPWVEMYNVTSFDPTKYRYIDVKYRATSNAGVMAFYMIENPSSETYTIKKDLICDGDWHIVTFDLWSNEAVKGRNPITGWRWDFADTAGATIEVDYIKIRE